MKGMVCICKYSVNEEQWMRAQIMRVNMKKRMVKVMLTDYGDTAILSFDDLREISSKYLDIARQVSS